MRSEILTGPEGKPGHGGEGDGVRESLEKQYGICMRLHRVGNNLWCRLSLASFSKLWSVVHLLYLCVGKYLVKQELLKEI